MKNAPAKRRPNRLWYLLLALPLAATLFPQVYAAGPALMGIPFFYWYQMLWIMLAGICTGIVYYATR